MYRDHCSPSIVRLPYFVFALLLTSFLCGSCVRGVFQPVNVGREYGDPVPLMVSHLGHSGPHYFLQNILCFDYMCRKGMGKRKAMRAISFEDYKKRIAKNAKKGMYKKPVTAPTPKVLKPDTIPVQKKAEPVAIVSPAPSVDAPILKADSLITLNDLLFETNSYKLKGEHFFALDSIARFLQAHPTLDVKVSGHTDSTGTERRNVALSTRRAEVVAQYLVDKGAMLDRVSFEGYGSSQPIQGNETEQGRSKNRRVEILISNPKKK